MENFIPNLQMKKIINWFWQSLCAMAVLCYCIYASFMLLFNNED